MVKILKKNNSIISLIILTMLFSCADKIEFTEYKSLPSASWEANTPISFEFNVMDTISPKCVYQY